MNKIALKPTTTNQNNNNNNNNNNSNKKTQNNSNNTQRRKSNNNNNNTTKPNQSNQLTKQIRDYIRLSTPNEKLKHERERVIAQLLYILNHSKILTRPEGGKPYRLVVFGSTSFGLDSNNSDLDICIIDPDRPQGLRENEANPKLLPPIYNMRKLAIALHRACGGFRDIQPIPTAKVPIVKFCTDPNFFNGAKISIDLNCNNLLAHRNSKLIAAYFQLSYSPNHRYNLFKSLAMIIKLWAKSRGHCDPSGQNGPISASSYTLILLLIAYLQSINHFPNLQDPEYLADRFPQRHLIHVLQRPASKRQAHHQKGGNKNKKPTIVGIDTSFVKSPPDGYGWRQSYRLTDDETQVDATIRETLIGFFKFYEAFNFDQELVSIRDGGRLERDKPVEGLENLPPSPPPSPLNSLRQSLMKYPKNGRPNNNNSSTTDPLQPQKLVPSNIPILDYDHLEDPAVTRSHDHPTLLDWPHPMVVVDPFLYDRNTSGNIQRETFQRIRKEFSRACGILLNQGSLTDLCSPSIP